MLTVPGACGRVRKPLRSATWSQGPRISPLLAVLIAGLTNCQSSNPQGKIDEQLKAARADSIGTKDRLVIESLKKKYDVVAGWEESFKGLDGVLGVPYTLELQRVFEGRGSSFLLIGSIRDVWRAGGRMVVLLISTRPPIPHTVFVLDCDPETEASINDRGSEIFAKEYAVVATRMSVEPSAEGQRTVVYFGEGRADVEISSNRRTVGGVALAICPLESVSSSGSCGIL